MTTSSKFPLKGTALTAESVYSEIFKADLILADISRPLLNSMYEIGLAHSLGKTVIFLINEEVADKRTISDISFLGGPFISYTNSEKSLRTFQKTLTTILTQVTRRPRLFGPVLPFRTRQPQPLYRIELEKLQPREFENFVLNC